MIQKVFLTLCLPAIALTYPNLLEGGHHHAHAHDHAAATPDVHLETPHVHPAGYDIHPPPPPPPVLYETPDSGSVEEEEEEPTPFKYDWAVSDAEAGLDFGQKSEFDGQAEKGQYHVLLPDGRILTVVYVADATGYNPVVTFEGEAHYPAPVPDPIHAIYETPA